jgi:hypothetical protein
MKTFRISTILLITLVLLFVNVATVLAVPPLPSSFYGTVKANGANVPGCIQVSARINGVQYALSHFLLYGDDTVYSLDVPGDDPETTGVIEGGVPGNTVDFYVGNVKADQTAPWQSGMNVNLNLTVSSPVQCNIFLPMIKHL